MGRVEASLRALIEQAWSQHHRDPAQLLPLGERIVAEAGADAVAAAWGWLHQAWGRRFRSEPEAAGQALAQAQAAFENADDEAGQAACRELQAMQLGLMRRWDEALALLALNDTPAASARPPLERSLGHQRRAWLLDALGDRDASLRERYAGLATARESGDDAAVAHALGLIGGMHADLFDLEEAARLCAEGMALAERSGAAQAWRMAALNCMNALVAQGLGTQAAPLAEQLLAQEPQQNPRGREQRFIVYADAFAQAGECARAQALLDESRTLRHTGSESLLSWTTAQAVVMAAQARWAPLRALAEAWLAAPQHGTDPGSVPGELLRLLRLTSRACQALGDDAAALAWERQAFDVHEALVGRSARARRLALEVEHHLALERTLRQQAEGERTRLDGLATALHAANVAKTRFLAAASHDLRQPVQALALNMAALELETVTPAQRQLVQRMGASLQALSQMFDVLLDISRLDAGTVPVSPQPLALGPLLRRLADDAAPQAAARGLQLRLHLPRHATALMTVSDPVLLERCLRNALDNALKFTRSGGILLAAGRRGGGWQLRVIDTGIGMTPEVQARVFEEFYQADNAERDRRRGLGLGLAIVERLTRLLGHGLVLRSRPGRGTCLRLQLPATPEPEASQADPGPAPAAPGPLPLCVAVVDDDADVRAGLVALLERWGHHVLAAQDGDTLLAHWRRSGLPPVDALLCDLRLPGAAHGVQVVALLRQAWRRPALPALVITGDVAPERLQLLRESGLPWLPKPVMPMRLRSWLAQVSAGA